ncbi:MAG: glycosyltransferase family 2 protein [Deltaproteobacteria bacterium]|nr:glycosyltransferase family 2 protein [Deltaproteobacteria bacterium]
MRISVIIPFYNAQRTIEKCAEALLGQTYSENEYEIIMIDNNSRDASAEIVKRYPRIQLVSEEKQGAYAARNKGLKKARGQIIAFTDPDCIPSDDWLEKIASALEHSRIGIVIGSRKSLHGSSILSMLEAYEHEKNDYVFRSKIKEIYFGYCNNMAVRKELLDEVGPFVERPRGSDTIFIRRAVEEYSSDIVRYVPDIWVRHMEIDRISRLYQKFFIYGRSRKKFEHIAYARPLTNRERFIVFRRTIKHNRYSLMKSSLLFGSLAVGLVFWVSGAASAAWSSRQ